MGAFNRRFAGRCSGYARGYWLGHDDEETKLERRGAELLEARGPDGYETATAICHGPRLRELPMAIATQRDRDDTRITAGACDHIATPVEPSMMRALLKSWRPG